jgi:hypothetical protein
LATRQCVVPRPIASHLGQLDIDRKEIWRRLLATLIKPMVTAEWWQKEMDVLEQIVKEVRCYVMKFDQSGAIVEVLRKEVVGER